MMIAREKWLPIPGYSGRYLVSDGGRIMNAATGHEMAPFRNHRGYLTVKLPLGGGRYRSWRVHRLVLMAFVGPPKAGEMCRHLDGNQLNNSLDNLAWGTASENQIDQLRHGKYASGARQPKLRIGDVMEIKARVLSGENRKDVAARFGVSRNAIDDIASGNTWSYVPVNQSPADCRQEVMP